MKPLAQKPTKPILSTRNTPQTFTLNKLAKPIVRDDIFSLPPAVYGTIYLTLIPLFGFLYSTLPNMQFNHENVGFLEDFLNQDTDSWSAGTVSFTDKRKTDNVLFYRSICRSKKTLLV